MKIFFSDLIQVWTKRDPNTFRDEAVKLATDVLSKVDKKFHLDHSFLIDTNHSECP